MNAWSPYGRPALVGDYHKLVPEILFHLFSFVGGCVSNLEGAHMWRGEGFGGCLPEP